MNKKYVVISLLPRAVEIIQSNSLSSTEEVFISNYALPFGSDWKKINGARSVKVFAINKNEFCIAYTIIVSSNDHHKYSDLYCLASIQDAAKVDSMIRKHPDWITRLMEPYVSAIENQKLARAFQESLSSIITKTYDARSFRLYGLKWIMNWLLAQLHIKLLPKFSFHDPNGWVEREEFARRLYIATNWQRQLSGFFSRARTFLLRIPVIRQAITGTKPPVMVYPSISTLSLSRGEFTDITILAIPINPLGRG